jgi:hypothetical protein
MKFLSSEEAKTAQQESNVHETEVARAAYVGELIDYQLKIKNHLIRARGEVRTLHQVGERVAIKLDPDQLTVLSR